jgi:uncharacterized protein YhaN
MQSSTIATGWLPLLLLSALATFSWCQEPATTKSEPIQDTRSSATPNVVLGRDLISATKAVEDLQLRLGLVLTSRAALDRAIGELAKGNRSLAAESKSIDFLKPEIEELDKRIRAIRATGVVRPRLLNEAPAASAVPARVNDGPPDEAEAEFDKDEFRLPIEQLNELELVYARQRELEQKLRQIINQLQNATNSSDATVSELTGVQFNLNFVQRSIILGTAQPSLFPMAAPSLQSTPLMAGSGLDSILLQTLLQKATAVPDSGSGAGPAPVPSGARFSHSSFLRSAENRLEDLRSNLHDAESAQKAITEKLSVLDDTIKSLEGKFGTTKAKLEADLDKEIAIKNALEKNLSDRDQEISQSRINLWLVGAVFLMVLVIFFLLVPLAYYSDKVSELIIESRVFVEVLSMSFLLLTVIILGTGRLVSGEGLAGLLGTIAGYIFARKTAELNQVVPPSARRLRKVAKELIEAEAEVTKVKDEIAVLEAAAQNDDRDRALATAKSALAVATSKADELRRQLATESKYTDPIAGQPPNTEP